MKISVCIATYNGARFILEQVQSILPQLSRSDEVVVVDDASSDETIPILKRLCDRRILISQNEHNCGVVRTFERALEEATGDIVFLCDQDDIWRADKIALMVRAFAADPRVTLVVSNGEVIDSSGSPLSWELYGHSRFISGVLPNLIKNRYQGSAMAFRREVLEAALPFPDGIPMHDSWIGLANAAIGRTVYLPEKLLLYRRHEGNVTSLRHGSILQMTRQRMRMIWSLMFRLGKIVSVKSRLCEKSRGIAADAAEGSESSGKACRGQHRAVVIAPFFSVTGGASRPQFVGEVLADLMPVDVVSSDFDHSQKIKREPGQCWPFDQVIYLNSRPYYSNVSFTRLLSHVLFSLEAALYFRRNRDDYDLVYVTVPLNVLAWLVFKKAGTKTKIIDVVDIWPDVLPFSTFARKVLALVFWVWKWFFKSAVRKADIVMAVSDSFIHEAFRYASDKASVQRFYIGHNRLVSAVSKEQVFTVAYVGNLGRLYDFDTLVDVLGEAKFRNTVQLFIIGQGDRQEWLVGELERRKIQYRFFGAVFEPDRLAEILRSCHVGFNGYINTTAAFSYKAATYFAAGLPIINSMTGDLQYLVKEHGLGENYEGGNHKQLNNCLLRFMQNGTTVMAANCESFFASHLESGKISADMKDFLFAKLHAHLNSGGVRIGSVRA